MRALPTGILIAVGLVLGGAGCANVLGVEDLTILHDGEDSSVNPESPPEAGKDADGATLPGAASDGFASDAGDANRGGDSAVGADAKTSGNDGSGASDGSDANSGADSSMCVAGGPCSPAECQVGQYACNGGLTCASVQPATNGTPCGAGDGGDSGTTGSVCNQGVCSPCDTGGDCSIANSCKKSVYVCSTGTAVCTVTGNANDGTGCGTGMYCYGGVCSACAVNNPCTPTNACHSGTVSSCAGGVATCMDTGQAAANGTSCGSNQVCNGGMCSACAANVTCTPANGCHTGLTSCASGTSVCVDTGNSQTDGTTCTGSNACFQTYTCQNGSCSGSNPVSCSGGMACQNGSCMCPGGTTNCSGTCANFTNDSNNCGRCNHPCLGGGCSGGMCQVFTFTTLGSTIADLATDGNVVVWSDSGDNSVDEVATAGGTKIVLASSSQGVTSPTNIAIDPSSGTVYWLNASGSQIGCSARVAQGGTPGTPSLNSLGVGTIISNSAHGLVSTGADGAAFLSAAMVYQTSCGATVAPVGGTSSPVSGATLAKTPNGFVFSDSTASQIVIIGSGGTASTIAGQSANYVATDGTYAYWAPSSSVERALLTSTTAVPVITNTGANATGLATDGNNVYMSANNEVIYAPASQTSSSALVLTNTNGTFLKYASGALFFANGGTIYKIATP